MYAQLDMVLMQFRTSLLLAPIHLIFPFDFYAMRFCDMADFFFDILKINKLKQILYIYLQANIKGTFSLAFT